MLHFIKKAKLDLKLDLILLLFITVATVKFTYSVETINDVGLWDETYYLERGVRLDNWGLPQDSWAGLYAIWYYLLSLIESDEVQLYYLNYKVLVLTSTILFYLLLRGMKVSRFLAATASVFYVVSNVPQAWPYVNLFALLILLLSLNVATRLSSDEDFYLAAGLGILLMSFVRAEYVFALILFGMWLLIDYGSQKWGRHHFSATSAYKAILFIATLIVLFYVFGNPLGGNRDWVAFGQHFSYRYAAWNHINCTDLCPWIHWREITKDAFGEASSITEAAMSNGPLFARHVLENAGVLVLAWPTLLFVTPFSFVSFHVHTALVWLQLGLFVGAAIFLARRLLCEPQVIKQALPRRFLVVCAIMCAPSIVSALLVYPRWHYLAIPTTILLLLFWLCFSSVLAQKALRRRMTATGAALFGFSLLFAIPNLAHGWLPGPAGPAAEPLTSTTELSRVKRVLESRFYWSLPNQSTIANYWLPRPFAKYKEGARILENRSVIHFIRSMNIAVPINILEAPGYSIYLTDNYVSVYPWEKDRSFTRFIQARQIDMIVVEEFLLADRDFLDDMEFQAFLENPNEQGYLKLAIPGSSSVVFVRSNLLGLQ